MIKHLYRSKSDIENLSKLRTNTLEIDNFNYKKKVVNKPWGYEYLMFENSFVAIWVLFIKYKHGTSMHCHPNKRTSLVVLSGNVVCSTLEGWIDRKEGEGLLIDEGVFHSTRVVSKRGAFVMEIESPPNKKDLVRLKDEYGREKKGYEGKNKMTNNLNKYIYVDFHEDGQQKKQIKRLKKYKLSIHSSKQSSAFTIQNILTDDMALICLLQGEIHDSKGNTLLSVGETCIIAKLKKHSVVVLPNDIIYLLMIRHEK